MKGCSHLRTIDNARVEQDLVRASNVEQLIKLRVQRDAVLVDIIGANFEDQMILCIHGVDNLDFLSVVGIDPSRDEVHLKFV
jgi:hypothetical protein